ncbi:NADPH-dependent FMN reductase [Streptomyces sp. N35]|uniref:NADPH-dependent FMN reductase n=1 Tax=Streptomyces sp. N35 TaxID=2795730 RepID=UPI0018F5B416|nr:NADPH-dependent FMN reductase [Streptomyces sp. N35]
MPRRLQILSASTRPTSAGRPLAHWVTELAAAQGQFAATLVDLGEVGLPFFDEPGLPADGVYVHEHTKAWSATVSAAECFVFVLPMYNGGFTAPLKNAIDSLYAEWRDKPVGLISYSAGASGGAPALDMLHPVLARVGLRPAPHTLSIPGIDRLTTPGGRFHPTPELTTEANAVLSSVGGLVGTPVTA